MAYTAPNNQVWAACGEGSISVWNTVAREQVTVFKAHASKIFDILVAGDYIWTCSEDKTIRIWLSKQPSKLKKELKSYDVTSLGRVNKTVWAGCTEQAVSYCGIFDGKVRDCISALCSLTKK